MFQNFSLNSSISVSETTLLKMASWPEIAIVKSNNRCELVLSGKSISERIESKGLDDELFTCTNLNFLRISETSLTSIPPKIDSLHNLTSLVLHSNKLTELCSEIGNLTKLKLLDASNNEIKAIPESLSKLEALSTLKLSFNKIEKIPNLSQNKWLSIVDLSCNEIEDISEICHNELVHLVELHLKGNKIKEIPSSIKELSALKILNMNENQIVQIPGEVSDIPKLKEVNFQGNPIGDKKLLRIVTQGKSKSILEYVREHSVRENGDHAGQKGKKGKSKGRTKHNSTEGENEQGVTSKHKILVTKTDDMCIIKRADYCQTVRPHIIACIVKNVTLDVDTMKKFIQLQTRLHEGICDKRNAATIATHDLDLCKGRKFTYTAVSPDGLKITPLSRNKEFSGKELFTQLQTEADNVRKEKKRNTYSGIHKYLHLLEGKPLYPCLLNSENTVISFPPITNSDLTKINVNTKNILIEVTSSTSQNVCKKVADALLKEMVLASIAVTVDENETQCLTVEQVRIEETDGNLIAVYPSRADLVYEDGAVIVVRD